MNYKSPKLKPKTKQISLFLSMDNSATHDFILNNHHHHSSNCDDDIIDLGLSLRTLQQQPDHDHDHHHHHSRAGMGMGMGMGLEGYGEEVMNWPGESSSSSDLYMKNNSNCRMMMMIQSSSCSNGGGQDHHHQEDQAEEVVQSKQQQQQQHQRWGYVKVNMDGVIVGRKVCIFEHGCYSSLALQLEDMFGRQCESGLKLFENESEFSLLYKDGDENWRSAGDVPWKQFVEGVKRLRIAPKDEGFVV